MPYLVLGLFFGSILSFMAYDDYKRGNFKSAMISLALLLFHLTVVVAETLNLIYN